GVVNHGDCRVMSDAALAALLPTFTRTDTPTTLVNAFYARGFNNQYKFAAGDAPHSGQIIWIDRTPMAGVAAPEQKNFDQFDANLGGEPTRLSAQLTFWYPMKVPFANWVMSRMFLALWG